MRWIVLFFLSISALAACSGTEPAAPPAENARAVQALGDRDVTVGE